MLTRPFVKTAEISVLETTLTLVAGALVRLVAMGIGAFLCFLGYRLFSIVPLANPGDAELSGLKGTTIKLTRIGPGIFFALFGALTVIWATSQPLSYNEIRTNGEDTETIVIERQVGAVGSETSQLIDTSDAERTRVKQEIRWLNQVQLVLTDTQRGNLVDDPDYIVPSIKKRLMLATWDSDAWGDASAFVQWLNETGGIGKPKDPKTAVAAEIYTEMP